MRSMSNKKSAESIVPSCYQRDGEGTNLATKKLNPHYIAGFIDGEGSFVFFFSPRKDIKSGFETRIDFQIELRIDDREILERIKETLGCGVIHVLNYERYKKWMPHVKYRISKINDLRNKLIPFLRKYPLHAKKRKNFEIFAEAVEIKWRKEHKTKEGIKRLKELRKQIEKLRG